MATTITVDDDTLQRFNALKANTGDENVPELSADAFLKSLMDAWEENDESIYGQQHADIEMPETDINEAKDEILGRIDDLEARLPRKISEELHS